MTHWPPPVVRLPMRWAVRWPRFRDEEAPTPVRACQGSTLAALLSQHNKALRCQTQRSGSIWTPLRKRRCPLPQSFDRASFARSRERYTLSCDRCSACPLFPPDCASYTDHMIGRPNMPTERHLIGGGLKEHRGGRGDANEDDDDDDDQRNRRCRQLRRRATRHPTRCRRTTTRRDEATDHKHKLHRRQRRNGSESRRRAEESARQTQTTKATTSTARHASDDTENAERTDSRDAVPAEHSDPNEHPDREHRPQPLQAQAQRRKRGMHENMDPLPEFCKQWKRSCFPQSESGDVRE